MHESIILPTFGLHAHTALLIYTLIVLVVFAVLLKGKFALVPGKIQSMLELGVELFMGLVEETMGHRGKKYVPFILTLAFLILICNALSFIPGLMAPTANFNTTMGLGLTVFFATHIIGVKEHGLKYFKHFIGPAWWLAPLIIPIELIGHLARPISLSLRLFGNIMGHEQIVGVFLIMMPFAYPLLVVSTLLGVLVVFLQSFIFSLLAMMYIGGALEEIH
ncbi:MAG: F0F1 ATP synthase subunit A [Deltaproteobacteria bacterium]|nr:F0F1 ATP synthase subunit A [Deltaproteobacteria bacterium]